MRSQGSRRGGTAIYVALLAAALGGSSAAGSAAAETGSPGACSGDEGVTVVADFGTLGGGVQTRCAPEPVKSGFDALSRAGFAYEVIPGGFLCRIDGKPSNRPCNRTPPPDYYWSYWLASGPGGDWTYSDMGAGSRDPEPGSVEGWAFVDGCERQPGESTNCEEPTTTSTSSAPTTTRPSGSGGGPSTTRPGGGAPAATDVTDDSPTGTTAPGTSGAGGDAPLARDDGSHDEDDDAADDALDGRGASARATGGSSGTGSPSGVLAGAAAVALLAVGAARRTRGRRVRPAEPEAG